MKSPRLFEELHRDKIVRARTGCLYTSHGDVLTPAFVPCGTQGAVKSLAPSDISEIGIQLILANTYHLYLRPGDKILNKFKGIHQFMSWKGPIVTDSGGFQATMLGNLTKIDEEGVDFRSHIDGSKHRFTAEKSIEFQVNIGSDLIMSFDQSTPVDADHLEAKKVLERTHRWEERSLKAFNKLTKDHSIKKQYLYGILQGGSFEDLRQESARFVVGNPFDGIAIGGGTIGHDYQDTEKILQWVVDLFPKERPIHTLGLGVSPDDILLAVEYGVDTFDCVAPTRLARSGLLYISPKNGGKQSNRYRLNITNSKYQLDKNPIDPGCLCMVCGQFSRAYLRHLFLAKELLAYRLASYHNLFFLTQLCGDIRKAINSNTFKSFKKEWM